MKVRLKKEYIWQMMAVLLVLSLVAIAFAGCESEQPPEEVKTMLSVSTSAFEEGGGIPIKYSCEGEDVSPALQWDEPPVGTQSFTLIMDDPDAPVAVFTHWVIFNIPSDSRQLAEAIPPQDQLPRGALQGKNDFGRIGYGGPCPPPGSAHRYHFTLYAVDIALDAIPGASKKQVLDAMEGHILDQDQLTGTYQR